MALDQFFYVPSTVRALAVLHDARSALPNAPVVPEPEPGRLRRAAATLLRTTGAGLTALADRLVGPVPSAGTPRQATHPVGR
jgi:hypothetical protein